MIIHKHWNIKLELHPTGWLQERKMRRNNECSVSRSTNDDIKTGFICSLLCYLTRIISIQGSELVLFETFESFLGNLNDSGPSFCIGSWRAMYMLSIDICMYIHSTIAFKTCVYY
ncbi:hypothetical protein Dimus_027301 [Dionaea muscipula]